MKRLLKQLIPSVVFDRYHYALAKLAAFLYGNPSTKMIVIGVTGTNGKSTVCAMIARIFTQAGFRVGLASTVLFRVANEEWLNDTKMTMLGRMQLQRLLRRMVRAQCAYAVVETSSEGIKQYRHVGVRYDVAVFTNLTPEHLESHGGFEKYKNAKGELFAKLSRDPVKMIRGQSITKVSVVNGDSPHAQFFLGFSAEKKYGFFTERRAGDEAHTSLQHLTTVKAQNVVLTAYGSTFTVSGVPFTLRVPGLFNIENALAAVSVGLSQGVTLATMADALATLAGVPGRLEFVNVGQPFTAIVDYAPEPESFRRLYEVVALLPKKRVIHVLGSTGGGRDKDRRPILGRLAAENADIVIVTNEDPYDDDPMTIINDVARGARDGGKKDDENLFMILDRGEAIKKAVALASAGDLVLVTGKGAEQAMCVAGGKKIPWDDRAKLREAIAKNI